METGCRLSSIPNDQLLNQSLSYIMKCPQKPLYDGVLRASKLMNTPRVRDGAPQLHGDRSSCAQDPRYLLIWLFIFILYNKL